MSFQTSRTTPLSRRLSGAGAGLLLLSAGAWSQEPAPARPASSAAPAMPTPAPAPPVLDPAQLAAGLTGLVFDEPGDGALWARGESYKARFAGRGATIVPYFGADAPRNYPLSFEVVSAALGGVELASAAHGTVSRDGSLVRIDHGAFVEEYELEERSLEQRFVFPTLPGKGELRVRVAVSTELAARAAGEGLRFENEHGHVDYSGAFVLDAAGRREAIESELVNGGIELRVPASFVDRAAFPLTIDPFVTSYTVAGSSNHEIYPDVAYDASSDRWCVAWTSIWSATDYDCYVRRVTGDGTMLDTLTIDFTVDSWVAPAIANNNAFDQFLVCASVVPPSGVADVRGRFVAPVEPTVGLALQISPLDGAYRNGVDVGGDPYLPGGSYYCVVWQRYVHESATDIEFRIVSPGGTLGGIQTLNTSSTVHLWPSISNSTGLPGDGFEAWSVVWQARHSLADNDVYGAQINWNGSIRHPMFPIATTSWDETFPVVSTMLDTTGLGGPRPYMVVFERDFGSDSDVCAAVLQGPALMQQKNLVGDFDEQHWYRDQLAPSADSDGGRFLIGFEERDAPDGPNHDLYVSSYYWLNGELVPCELHASFAGSPVTEVQLALHSMAASGGHRGRFFGTWSYASANNGFDAIGGLWQGCGGFEPTSYCSGDDSVVPCPCGNTGTPGHGCANGSFASGAALASTGDASVGADDLTLLVQASVPNQPGLFFHGNLVPGDGIGVAFGDGLRCAGGAVVRLQVRVADGTGAVASTVGLAAAGGISPGDVKYYQWWYRDPAGSPCGAKFNLSNGLEVLWVH